MLSRVESTKNGCFLSAQPKYFRLCSFYFVMPLNDRYMTNNSLQFHQMSPLQMKWYCLQGSQQSIFHEDCDSAGLGSPIPSYIYRSKFNEILAVVQQTPNCFWLGKRVDSLFQSGLKNAKFHLVLMILTVHFVLVPAFLYLYTRFLARVIRQYWLLRHRNYHLEE